jgi:hypothetical protein
MPQTVKNGVLITVASKGEKVRGFARLLKFPKGAEEVLITFTEVHENGSAGHVDQEGEALVTEGSEIEFHFHYRVHPGHQFRVEVYVHAGEHDGDLEGAKFVFKNGQYKIASH